MIAKMVVFVTDIHVERHAPKEFMVVLPYMFNKPAHQGRDVRIRALLQLINIKVTECMGAEKRQAPVFLAVKTFYKIYLPSSNIF